LRNETELMLGSMRFINHSKIENEIERKMSDISEPFFYELSDYTTILKIPSFNLDQKPLIDKKIEQNKEKILSHKNLIIDLRNNGGGGDNSWKELIPIIYTNPIKTVGVEYLSTGLNREYLLQNLSFIQRIVLRGFIKKLKSNDGQFVVRDSVYTTELDEVLPNPQNIVVVVDDVCGSSVEQFLLAAKQSEKVRIYGKQTYGALDVSNVTSVLSPDGCFRLGYCTTRTLRPEKDRIDDIGIKPDVEINDSIPGHKWMEFILKEIDN
jgi:C-terminal processing protease CtpA/Prc